jgi:hypothetical protein
MPGHPDKHVEAVLAAMEAAGWRIRKSAGRAHAWGMAYCPGGAAGCPPVGIQSTPAVPQRHARWLQRALTNCPHC